MPIRYSDFKKRSESTADFVARKYDPSLLKLILLFFAALAIGISITALLLPPLYLIISLTVVMAILGSYVLLQIQRTRDLVVSTEYQNAMFASAIGYNCRFCIIIKREGAIIYMDPGIQRMFPDLIKERQISLSHLLKLGRVSTVEREKILDMVQRAQSETTVFEMRSADNRIHSLLLSVQPIVRPAGFLLLRTRDYTEDQQRAHAAVPTAAQPQQPPNPLLNKSSIAMFAHIMDRMDMGLYMTDMGGNMLYANPVLESWLMFQPGDITVGNFTMRDIVHGVSMAEALNPGDFEGEHSLLKKQGGLVKAYINQKIIYGDNNKPLGCVALITNMIESDSELKKKLW